MRKNPNKSFYHYLAHIHDDDGELIDHKYFLTLGDVMRTYDCCRKTVANKLQDPESKGRKLKNIKLYRIHEPTHIIIENPIINFNS
jgi:hypothetical protein